MNFQKAIDQQQQKSTDVQKLDRLQQILNNCKQDAEETLQEAIFNNDRTKDIEFSREYQEAMKDIEAIEEGVNAFRIKLENEATAIRLYGE